MYVETVFTEIGQFCMLLRHGGGIDHERACLVFADSLSLSDEVILTEIYPAREQPIPGVTSQLIYDNLRPGIEKCICRKEDVLSLLAQKHTEVLVVLGAGDLDNYAPQITQLLSEKYHG